MYQLKLSCKRTSIFRRLANADRYITLCRIVKRCLEMHWRERWNLRCYSCLGSYRTKVIKWVIEFLGFEAPWLFNLTNRCLQSILWAKYICMFNLYGFSLILESLTASLCSYVNMGCNKQHLAWFLFLKEWKILIIELRIIWIGFHVTERGYKTARARHHSYVTTSRHASFNGWLFTSRHSCLYLFNLIVFNPRPLGYQCTSVGVWQLCSYAPPMNGKDDGFILQDFSSRYFSSASCFTVSLKNLAYWMDFISMVETLKACAQISKSLSSKCLKVQPLNCKSLCTELQSLNFKYVKEPRTLRVWVPNAKWLDPWILIDSKSLCTDL